MSVAVVRDEAALSELYDRIIAAYPRSMQAFRERKGLTERQLRMSIRILIRREQHGDAGATKCLDDYEAMLAQYPAGTPLPCEGEF